MNVDFHLNKEDGTPRAMGPWTTRGADVSWTFAAVMYGDLTVHMRNEDGARRALGFADALREAAGAVLAELEGVTS